MPRPTILCHMVSSLDGRLLTRRWPVDQDDLMATYEEIADRLDAQGWIVGRTSMAEIMDEGDAAATDRAAPRADVIQSRGGRGLAIGIDRQGRLRPESGLVGEDHLVLVVSERVSEDHVARLAERGVSVVFAGPEGTDLPGALERIGAAFGTQRLLLEGGGTINGAFQDAGLIDETSTIVLPVLDGGGDIPAIYRGNGASVRSLKLIGVETLDGDAVWMRHAVEGPRS